MESARRATADDAAVVADLARSAIAELARLRGGSVWHRREARREPLEPDLAAACAQDTDPTVVVGTIDDSVVGYGVMHLDVLHDGLLIAVVDDLYVLPDARGVGVGEAMMNLLVESARKAGAIGVDAVALPGDRSTKNFFESFGLVARAITVHKSLDAGAAAAAPDDHGATTPDPS